MRAGHVGWVSLDVNSSVSDWLQSTERGQGGLGRHLSLRVAVSDAQSRAPVNAFTVFRPPNCAEHQSPHPGTINVLHWRSWDFQLWRGQWNSHGLGEAFDLILHFFPLEPLLFNLRAKFKVSCFNRSRDI